jgi:hypothetical protein
VLYYLSPACCPFCYGYFWEDFTFLLRLQSSYLPFPRNWDNRYVPPCPRNWDNRCAPPCPSICWDGVWRNFCSGWTWTLILPISVSQEAGILPRSGYFYFF